MDHLITYLGGPLDGRTEAFSGVPDSETWREDPVTRERHGYVLYLFDPGGHAPTLAYVHQDMPVATAEARLAERLRASAPAACPGLDGAAAPA